MRGMSGAAALARAKQKREAAVAAQAERVEAEQAAIKLANERARERGLVEKTAGESGAAGNLCNNCFLSIWKRTGTLSPSVRPWCASWRLPRPPPSV